MPKPPVTWEAGDNDWLVTGQGGLGVIGQLLATTSLGSQLNASCVLEAKQPEISHRDVAFSFIGLLAQGQPDYDAIEAFRADPFFCVGLESGAGALQPHVTATARPSRCRGGHRSVEPNLPRHDRLTVDAAHSL